MKLYVATISKLSGTQCITVIIGEKIVTLHFSFFQYNRFQAVVATDYEQSYVAYIYDTYGMRWRPVYRSVNVHFISY